MTLLYLCEKPSQAKDIARVLGAKTRKDGFFKGDANNDIVVTWCFGHLLEMASPEEYDSKLKQWNISALPIVPDQWIWKVRKDAKKQYKIIISLFRKTNKIIIATDADREGEYIAREIMDKGGWSGPVSRLWLSALDDESIRKALKNILPSEQTEPLYFAAKARSQADWLVGMNLTRLYTLSAQKNGYQCVMSVGRVQTPTLKLVVDRDRVIENFKAVPYFEVITSFATGKGDALGAKWKVPDHLSDEEGRCLSQLSANNVAEKGHNQTGVVKETETKRVKEPPPLLYELSSLQQESSKCFGMGAQQVLDCAQALYETHKIITYPRTDCPYLPTSQFELAETIVRMLEDLGEYREVAQQANLSLQSKVWNDKKVTAHHAIIPTGSSPDGKSLSEQERQLFDLIVRRYLAQFYPAFEYDQTKLVIAVGEDIFTTSGRQVVVPGWKTVIGTGNSKRDQGAILPPVQNKDKLTVVDSRVEPKQTQPPDRYTEGSLVNAMKNIGRTVDNPALKKRLKETSGIGTVATRASIIEVLLKRGFIQKKGKKHLLSTEQARSLIDALPEPVKDPATTAVWEQALDEIAQGKGNAEQFVKDQVGMVIHIINEVKKSIPSSLTGLQANNESFPCPECSHALVRRKGANGFFWGCLNYPECKITLPDIKGKPGQTSKPLETGKKCPECEQGELVKRIVKKGKNAGKYFFGCNQYPGCQYTEG